MTLTAKQERRIRAIQVVCVMPWLAEHDLGRRPTGDEIIHNLDFKDGKFVLGDNIIENPNDEPDMDN